MDILCDTPVIYTGEQLERYLTEVCGFSLMYRGKVRDVYRINSHQLLVVATDRVSVYDFNLGDTIVGKGEILTAFTHFWTHFLKKRFSELLTDFEKSENMQYPQFNAVYDLHLKYPGIPIERCLVVRNECGKLDPFEMIFRSHIGGSIYDEYIRTGMLAGQQITPNLPIWTYLGDTFFCPSTKEHKKHDRNIPASYYFNHTGYPGTVFVTQCLTKICQSMYEHTKECGLVMFDTKLETSLGNWMVVDEIGTPDSTRYGELLNWEKAMQGKESLRFLDKQIVRDWASKAPITFENKIVRIKDLDPAREDHRQAVKELKVPGELHNMVIENYINVFKRLARTSLREYQRKEMGVGIILD